MTIIIIIISIKPHHLQFLPVYSSAQVLPSTSFKGLNLFFNQVQSGFECATGYSDMCCNRIYEKPSKKAVLLGMKYSFKKTVMTSRSAFDLLMLFGFYLVKELFSLVSLVKFR